MLLVLSLFFFLISMVSCFFFFFSSRRRHTRFSRDWSSDVCSSDLLLGCSCKFPCQLAGLADIEPLFAPVHAAEEEDSVVHAGRSIAGRRAPVDREIGRASCRERV